MGGHIGVRTTAGVGSTFWFEIPLLDAEDTAATDLSNGAPACVLVQEGSLPPTQQCSCNAPGGVAQWERYTYARPVLGGSRQGSSPAASNQDSTGHLTLNYHQALSTGFSYEMLFNEKELDSDDSAESCDGRADVNSRFSAGHGHNRSAETTLAQPSPGLVACNAAEPALGDAGQEHGAGNPEDTLDETEESRGVKRSMSRSIGWLVQ